MKFLFAALLALPVLNIEAALGANPSCLTAPAVEEYSRRPAVKALTETAAPKKIKKGFSLRYVREALEKNGLVKAQAGLPEGSERGGETDNLKAGYDDTEQPALDSSPVRALNARDASGWLEANGFVNLSDCPEWKSALNDPKKVPGGAVVIYRHPRDDKHPGHIEIATPAGFWSDRPRNKREYTPGMDVVGVFVRAGNAP